MVLTLHAPAKVNLTLEVIAKRPDGYHEIKSVLQSIPFSDYLLFHTHQGVKVSMQPALVPEEDNLVYKAAHLLMHDCKIPGAHITLLKNIPIGRGLGGGSSDAAMTLLGLNALYQLHLSPSHLLHYAAQLGSDVPFFFFQGTCKAEGKGEKITPLPPLTGVDLLLHIPRSQLSTAAAYESFPKERLYEKGHTEAMVDDIRHQRGQALRLYNDFQACTLKRHPELEKVYKTLLEEGAFTAGLTGTGSGIIALADKKNSQKIQRRIPHTHRFHL